MWWSNLYQIRSYARSSLWVVPLVTMPFAFLTTRLLRWIDPGWDLLVLSPKGAEATLQLVVTATLSFVVFTFGSLLVAIQVASAQMTPRIIATTLLRNDVVKYTVSLFIFTLLFALTSQNRIDKDVPELVVFVAALLGISCFAAFFYLIDYASRLLRPISILSHVGQGGLAVIASVYPDLSEGPASPNGERYKLQQPKRSIVHQGTSGIVLAINLDAIRAEAEKTGGVIEFVPQVGDFVAVDEPLFKLYDGADGIDDDVLSAMVAFGSERTMEQDPTFAFRIVVDIALKALSPAINDPTTAVLAIDQLHRMLRSVGRRHLRTDEISDRSGQLRVICRTPNWEDFVWLAFSEIRACGSNNLQIVRRLRSMVENLIDTLPEHRHLALRQELSLLDRDIEKHFHHREELALARVADSQGLGGRSNARVVR
jgi:uncharacterized membrane protein